MMMARLVERDEADTAAGDGWIDVELKERFMKEIERDPAFRLDDIHDLTKNAIRERTMAKFSVSISAQPTLS